MVWSSCTVTRKAIVRATEGTTSQVNGPLFANAVKLGKYLVGLVVEVKLLKFGPPVDVATGGCVDAWLLYCSQR